MQVFRARMSRSGWAVLAVSIGICAALAAARPQQAFWIVTGFLLICAMIPAALLATRLEITETVVRARQGRSKKEVARAEICSIHFFPGAISIRGGADRESVLRTGPNWSLRQMVEVAGELRVPLYDHRRWLGLRSARMGRLVDSRGTRQPVR